jgi:hypothetical protein
MTKEEKKAERSNREGIVEVCFIDFFIAYENTVLTVRSRSYGVAHPQPWNRERRLLPGLRFWQYRGTSCSSRFLFLAPPSSMSSLTTNAFFYVTCRNIDQPGKGFG